MAPRAHRRTAGAPAEAASFTDVPTEVLQHILGCLESYVDRQRASMVCRRWYDCVHSGELCQQAWADGTLNYGLLNSLACWLQRHAQHVRSLRLKVGQSGCTAADDFMLLGCCLGTVGMVGRLERLHVSSQGGLVVTAAWMQPLRSLRELTLLGAPGGLVISTTLEHHTQLTALRLGGMVHALEDARLPPSLLRLHLEGRMSSQLPSTLSSLSRLSELELEHSSWHADGYAVLRQLPALRRLVLQSNQHLPACLSQLTQVEDLVLTDRLPVFLAIDPPEAVHSAIDAGLQPLTQLTSLYLERHTWHGDVPALASLPCLQRLCLDGGGPPSLPPGRWIGSLRELGTSWACLCNGMPALAGAAQLHSVVVVQRSAADPLPANHAFCAWAAEHLPLRSLLLHVPRRVPHELRAALRQLAQRRLDVQVILSSSAVYGNGPGACPFAESFNSLPHF